MEEVIPGEGEGGSLSALIAQGRVVSSNQRYLILMMMSIRSRRELRFIDWQ